MKKCISLFIALFASASIANPFYTATGNPQPLSRESSSVIQSEFQLIQNGFNLVSPINSPAFTGIPTAPTAQTGTSTNQIATTAFVANMAFSSILPGQNGNPNSYLTTNGSSASWAPSTGSGNVVLSTGGTLNSPTINSPTLNSPSLGTPTSIVLSNATGLPVGAITGLGTGVSSALSTNVNGSGGIVLSNSPTLSSPNLGTPIALVGTNITGTATSLSIGGNAATASSVVTANFSIQQVGGKLYFYYGSTPVASIDSAGNLRLSGDVYINAAP